MELLGSVREYGMRMVGPNCFGVVNTDPEVRLNATFGKTFPDPGRLGFITQSGAMGEGIMTMAKQLGIGFSIVASIGNKADISSNDMLEYFMDDPNTDVILMYMENFGNPRKFTQIAREVSKVKPLVAVKSGRTTLGAKAASSHTGALAGLDVGVEAVFEQTGVIRVDTVEELFDVAMALSKQPVPKGNRVVVVTNAGGPGILATDALISNDMQMPPLTTATVKQLREHISAEASFANPMDMVAGAGGREFRITLEAVKGDKRYDTILPIFVPPVTIDPMDVARSIQEALADTDKTVMAAFFGAFGEGMRSSAIDYLKEHGIPTYWFPEAIAKVLSRLERYRQWRDRPRPKFRKFKVDTARVQSIVDAAIGKGAEEVTIVGDEAIQVLQAYGIQAAGYHYMGHTEILAELTDSPDYRMCLFAGDIRVVHITSHYPMHEAIKMVTRDRVAQSIRIAHAALERLGLPRRRIGVAGLNPHAGEAGVLGTEEITDILPAIELCQKEGIDCVGPYPPDTVFKRMVQGEFDLVVAMYHDQGHIPVKLIAMDEGVNVTLGIPIVRTSVDHGTAYDIAGTGKAREDSLWAAIRLAVKLVVSEEHTHA